MKDIMKYFCYETTSRHKTNFKFNQWFASSIQLWATFKRIPKFTIRFGFVEIVEK